MGEIQVLDHGFVRLDDCMGDDLSVVNAARVSFGTRSRTHDEECGLVDGTSECNCRGTHGFGPQSLIKSDAGLIKFLMTNRHGTPFEHNSFKFHVKAPLFVVREWQRHRMASYNELSGRYKKFENPDFYIPDNFRTQTGKPGAYSFEDWKGNKKQAAALMARHNQDALDLYEHFIQNGMAKEQARIVLPLSLYTEFYFTVNARGLMNFLSLRNAPDAMYEIREYASTVEALWGEQMPVTAEAFRANGRIAP